jgi:hypothetical protein
MALIIYVVLANFCQGFSESTSIELAALIFAYADTNAEKKASRVRNIPICPMSKCSPLYSIIE